MKRVDILRKLEVIAPALANTDLIPILKCFWFTGSTVLAYNDQIGLSIPFKSDLRGAIPGSLLMSLLKASRAENIEMSQEGTSLKVKAASARFKLTVMSSDDFVFKMPKPSDGGTVPKDSRKELLAGIDVCLRSVSNDTSVPDQLGVTLIPSDKSLLLFSTNNATLSHARIDVKGKLGSFRAILPTSFCEQLLRITKDSSFQLEINKEYALASTTDGVLLFGRLIEADQPLDFPALLEHHLPKGMKGFVPIPSKMELVLERAAIITESEKLPTQISVGEDGKMMFLSQSKTYGEVSDVIMFEGHHPRVQAKVEAKLLRAGYGHFESILVTDRCAIMAGKNKYYMIACTS